MNDFQCEQGRLYKKKTQKQFKVMIASVNRPSYIKKQHKNN